MVNIAIAGGTGDVANEVIDALLAVKEHKVIIFTRSAPKDAAPEVSWRTVNYEDKDDLVKALSGVHTVLSFIQTISDVDQKSQRALIDASIVAGVKRFAPSEYSSARIDSMPFYAAKQKVRDYLKKVNENGKVLEYSLFQPGLFMDYLAFPHQTAKHVKPLKTVYDFENRRALVVDGHEDAAFTLTTAKDFATVLAKACGYQGEWPEVAGIQGNRVTVAQLLEIGARSRGKPFTVEKVHVQDLEAGKLETSWALTERHRAVADDPAENMVKMISIGLLLSTSKGAWDGSDELNRIFPDYKFTAIEDFLTDVWGGKP
ncbi:hypothetical protein BDV95DRAFT_579323 [Massariosphaeria phaeospora]|uniref:NmrA-like domain-containing protein n=1 Tax=Massariosphaeria phaeospora TaxID=100035 RepID=A0A7C8I404_9PLEO|nr:hypothetical protein BDV95DRAFT_579323 [Massariosphaeria phaeospora]